MPATLANDVNALFEEVSAWVGRQAGWVAASEVPQEELPNSSEWHSKPGIRIETPQGGRIHLESVGVKRDGTAVVEMYAWPTLVRVRLVRKPGKGAWEVITDSGIPFHMDWSEANFMRLLRDMIDAL